jgi:hypothetical protein
MEKKFTPSIGFWLNDNETMARTHKTGLTKEQIEFLNGLKEGDRLTIFVNDNPNGNAPHLQLKKSVEKKALV